MKNEFEKIKKQLNDELKQSKQYSNSFFNGATQEQMEELQRSGITVKKEESNDKTD